MSGLAAQRRMSRLDPDDDIVFPVEQACVDLTQKADAVDLSVDFTEHT